jgi:hypothetical protein
MLGLAIYWYNDKKEPEPLIAIIGQFATLLVILFESKISNIKTKNVINSKIKVDTEPGSKIHTSDIKDSEIDIKTK